ncbi:hypothetical protein L7F22_055555 [Adiantum nelumboides]|nr:hypothetical protein [Adiantum nelumboides]
MGKMARVADVAYKSTAIFLGACTIFFGANLVFNVSRGISWHMRNPSDTTGNCIWAVSLSLSLDHARSLKDSSLMATRSEQLNWQEIHLSEDEASAQGTHAVRFLVQQVEKAQNNFLLRPMLNNLMRAHGLQLLNYEPSTQDPTVQEVSNEGNAREERGAHSQDDASSERSRSSSRRIRRPLEREDNSLRYEVQKSGSKRRRSPSREVFFLSIFERSKKRTRTSCKKTL